MSVWKAWDCVIESQEVNGTICKYKIIPPRKHIHHYVTYDSSKGSISCTCRKFEFIEMLCSHALKVLSSRNITIIPNEYILKRWKKDAKVEILPKHNAVVPQEEKLCTRIRFQELSKLFTHFAGLAAESEETYQYALDLHQKALAQVEESLKRLICGDEGDNTTEDVGVAKSSHKDHCDITNVRGIKAKGHRGGGGRGRGSGRNSGPGHCKSALENGYSNKKTLPRSI